MLIKPLYAVHGDEVVQLEGARVVPFVKLQAIEGVMLRKANIGGHELMEKSITPKFVAGLHASMRFLDVLGTKTSLNPSMGRNLHICSNRLLSDGFHPPWNVASCLVNMARAY